METRKIKIPNLDKRVDTGITQFGDDWPGLFIRGDSAFGYTLAIKKALDTIRKLSPLTRDFSLVAALLELEELGKLLDSTNINEDNRIFKN